MDEFIVLLRAKKGIEKYRGARMATDDARLRDTLQRAKVGRLAIARIMLPCPFRRCRSTCVAWLRSWFRHHIYVPSRVFLPKKEHQNSGNTVEIPMFDK